MKDCKMCRNDYLAREPGTCLVCGSPLDDPGLRWTCDLLHAQHLFQHDSRWRDPAYTLAQLAGDAPIPGPSLPRQRVDGAERHVGRHRRR